VIILEIRASPKGRTTKIRELMAVNAIDESIGRSVEMGRPVYFSARVGNLTVRGVPVTLASLSFLSHIPETCARYACGPCGYSSSRRRLCSQFSTWSLISAMFRGQVPSLGSSNLGKVGYTAPSLDICGMLESTVKGSSSPSLAVQAVESFPYASHQGIG
jgi:hypothetical protein